MIRRLTEIVCKKWNFQLSLTVTGQVKLAKDEERGRHKVQKYSNMLGVE